MKVMLAGGSGFIGRALTDCLTNEGHEVVLLTRKASPAVVGKKSERTIVERWDGKTVEIWARHIDDAKAVINLAGESIASKRWSDRRKQTIVRSRVEATRALVESIRSSKKKPEVLINASAVGYYGDTKDEDVTENHGKGSDFLSGTVGQWEREASLAEVLGMRVVLLRFGVVLGPGGGALPRMLLPFRMFVGGPLGSGEQWFPWIHLDDVIGVIKFTMSTPSLTGPVNVTAPGIVRMKEFCSSLGRALHRPSWLPVPSFALRLVLGEMAGMLLTGQRARPKKLLESGYRFLFPNLDDALNNTLNL